MIKILFLCFTLLASSKASAQFKQCLDFLHGSTFMDSLRQVDMRAQSEESFNSALDRYFDDQGQLKQDLLKQDAMKGIVSYQKKPEQIRLRKIPSLSIESKLDLDAVLTIQRDSRGHLTSVNYQPEVTPDSVLQRLRRLVPPNQLFHAQYSFDLGPDSCRVTQATGDLKYDSQICQKLEQIHKMNTACSEACFAPVMQLFMKPVLATVNPYLPMMNEAKAAQDFRRVANHVHLDLCADVELISPGTSGPATNLPGKDLPNGGQK